MVDDSQNTVTSLHTQRTAKSITTYLMRIILLGEGEGEKGRVTELTVAFPDVLVASTSTLTATRNTSNVPSSLGSLVRSFTCPL